MTMLVLEWTMNNSRNISDILSVLAEAVEQGLINSYFLVPFKNRHNINGYTPYICIRLNLGMSEKTKQELISYIEKTYDNVRLTMTTSETLWIDHKL